VTAFHPDLLERHRRAIEQTGAVFARPVLAFAQGMADGLPAKVEVPRAASSRRCWCSRCGSTCRPISATAAAGAAGGRCGEHRHGARAGAGFFNGGADWQGPHGYLARASTRALGLLSLADAEPQGGVVDW